MQSFPGLAHRMEVIGKRGSVLFVNDSKATNADAAAKALVTFDPIYWIAGGQSKEGGIDSLREFFPRVAKAYLIGKAADEFSAVLSGEVPLRDRRRPSDGGADGGGRTPRSTAGLSPPCFFRQPAPRSTSSPISRIAAKRSAAPSPRSTKCQWRPSHDQPRSPLAAFRLVVDRRPPDAFAGAGAFPLRLRALLRGEPAGRRAPRPRQPAFRLAPRVLRSARGGADGRAVVPDAAAGAPRGAGAAHRLSGDDGRRPLHRRGDQGLAPLALPRRHVDPALRAAEAGLHRHHRVALRGRQQAARRSRQAPRRRAASDHLRASRRRAGSRADRALRHGVGRALLSGRREHDDLRRARRRSPRAGCSAPTTYFRTSPAASTASSIPKAATTSRS